MNLTKKSENIADWYNELVLKAELADYSPVRGCMVIRPLGYGIWENVQKAFNPMMKAHGVKNTYFPLFIPMSFFEREKDHVEGFAPELAVVTHGGGEELAEPLAVRPTSETIMYEQFSKWIESYRDLPLKINQWTNVVRWEKRTYLFLRTSEFLWQEGHTAHATFDDAQKTVDWALTHYTKLYQDYFAMYGIAGVKSESEKFAGADKTFTYEMLMPDGKALQGCTSHNLGQNFAKAFNVQFLDDAGERNYVWQTSWGFSTRSIGGMILMHGDDKGLVLPPRLAPTQIAIVPIFGSDEESNKAVESEADRLREMLGRTYEVEVDTDKEHSLGFRLNEWDLRGIPLRIEIGKKELADNCVSIYRRDAMTKEQVLTSDIETYVPDLLQAIHQTMFERSKKFTEDNTHEVNSYDEFKKIMETSRGFLKAFWCEQTSCEKKIKEETKATTRCLPLGTPDEDGNCIYCNNLAKHRWLFAQSY